MFKKFDTVKQTMTNFQTCNLCPRNCNTNREKGLRGFCGQTSKIKIASAGLHFGEEPPITMKGGSGTIFFTGCTLQCSFCQNYQISQDGMGKEISNEEFAELCLKLQSIGSENINLVTGSHFIPAIAEGLKLAKEKGLCIPVLWNSSSYENPDALELLKDLVTVWLPDLKTLNPELSRVVFKAPDYPTTAKRAIRKMLELSPLVFDKNGKIISGMILRHLVLPGKIGDTRFVLKWFSEHLKGKALLSVMSQYTPVPAVKNAIGKTVFEDRFLEKSEYDELLDLLSEFGIEDGFCQEFVNDTSWLPDFTRLQPFSSSLSKPIWHWTCGFIPNTK